MIMNAHNGISIVVCAASLAFAFMVWYRRSGNPIAPLLAILFLDTFAWNFAEVARSQTGAEQWHYVDRLFSTFMPAIALHLVIQFIGRVRTFKKWVILQYAVYLCLAASQTWRYWWLSLFVLSCLAMLVALVLLWRHWATNIVRQERERTELIMVAIVVGTLLGTTDLWRNEGRFSTPPLANVGMLLALILVWIAAQRSRLLDREIPAGLVAYASLAGTLLAMAFLADVHWLGARHGLWGAFVVSTAVIGLAVWREVIRFRVAKNERIRKHSMLGRLSEQLAHDLRNPLGALKGALQFLTLEHDAGRSLDDQAEVLNLTLAQVARLEKTVSNYQRMAKVEPVFGMESLNQVVHQVMSLQRFGLTTNASIRLDLAPELPNCSMDRDLMSLVLENLVRNACEAMPHGGEIVISTRQVTEPQSALLLRVEDNGQGMDARALERALELTRGFSREAG
jgi:two-component system, NtrC family, sensor histidine kinase HydH